jgi:polyphenol oxidase
MNHSDFITPNWVAPPGVRALCTLRTADTSALPLTPQWLEQVHGIAVADLDAPHPVMQADAALTASVGKICAVRTADCIPILISAADGSAVAAAHAGWRGLAAGVLENTVSMLRTRSRTQTLMAWLGPAISPAHFEVGDEVRAAFVAHSAVAEMAFVANRRGRWQCNIYQLARQRLAALGIDAVSGGEYCTFDQPEKFFSHRRDVQSGRSSSTGRMATLIWRAAGP